ncbi:hypothetical protein GCM10027610_123130 [Dactylosporangium cerinum]
MLGDRAGVAAGHRSGDGGVAEAQRVVQRRAEQRGEDLLRVPDAGVAEPVKGLVDQRGEVVGAVRQGRVVQRPALLGDPLDLPAEVGDQGGGELPQLIGGGDAERDPRRAGPGPPRCR